MAMGQVKWLTHNVNDENNDSLYKKVHKNLHFIYLTAFILKHNSFEECTLLINENFRL